MAVSEQARHELHQKLEQFLGPEAATLMEHPPPRGWGDVATRADLDHLAALTKRDIEQVEVRLEQMEVRVSSQIEQVEIRLGSQIEIAQRQTTETLFRELSANTRTMVFACIGAVMTSSGLAFAAARF